MGSPRCNGGIDAVACLGVSEGTSINESRSSCTWPKRNTLTHSKVSLGLSYPGRDSKYESKQGVFSSSYFSVLGSLSKRDFPYSLLGRRVKDVGTQLYKACAIHVIL